MSIIPLLGQNGADLETGAGDGALPLCREIDWDFASDLPVWRNGSPVFVTGARAVLVWAWNALHAERFSRDVFSADYGTEFAGLLGRGCSGEVHRAEAERTVKEALLINPYITGVSRVQTAFEGSVLRLSLQLDTVYGEVGLNEFNIAL